MSKELIDIENINLVSEAESLIKAGLISGYKQNIIFTQNYSDLQSRLIEYLIVVNIAQSLQDFCLQNLIQVNLEYPLNNFYNNAFPSFIFEGDVLALEYKERKNHTPLNSKTKRLDIVLSKDTKSVKEWFLSNKPLFGIEVKSINISKKKIKKDIDRLATAMSLTDSVGYNSIQACFVCFFRRFDNDSTTISKNEILKKTKNEKDKWVKYLYEKKIHFSGLDLDLIDINIVNLPVEDFKQADPELNYDHSDVLENTGFINAYMIKITRNAQN